MTQGNNKIAELDFPLKGDVTKKQIIQIQDRVLQIAIIVRDILKEGNIPYSIYAGTLLGAVRSGGFIPWDIDFDIAIPEERYDEASEMIEKSIPEWLVFQTRESDPNYCAYWGKVVDRYSELRSTKYLSDNLFAFKGVHVDVFKMLRTSEEHYPKDLLRVNLEYFELRRDRGLIDGESCDQVIDSIKREIESLEEIADRKRDEYFSLHYFRIKDKSFFSDLQISMLLC